MAQLLAWKHAQHRAPLLLRGARQVGKTWLLKEFGRRCYDRLVYVNLERSEAARRVFDGDPDPGRIVARLAALDGHGPIAPDGTLIVIDEIQEAAGALTSLKYFAEEALQYDVAAAGSLLGVALQGRVSFPVGKVHTVGLGPLCFTEFATALGRADLIELMESADPTLAAPFHEALIDLLRAYYVVGGMPAAVMAYQAGHDFASARAVQQELVDAYGNDFSKHAPVAEVPRLREIFRSVPSQLARENRKFVFGRVREGARARTHEAALQWLEDGGIVQRVHRVTAPRLPLPAYRDDKAFKAFLVDIGMLGALAELPPAIAVAGNDAFTEFKGALTEQFVAQELAAHGWHPYYWSSDSGRAEIDFLVAADAGVVPVEVKAEANLRARSLRLFREKYRPAVAARFSLAPYQFRDGLLALPLYALSTLRSRLAAGSG
jgi:predicted AAA+ superfamily ATPase